MQKAKRLLLLKKVTVAELLPQLEKTAFPLNDQPYASLFKIYQKEFLDVSVEKGLIHKDSLALAGDGTPVVTSHRERKNVSANVKKTASTTVAVTVTFLSMTAISAGIPRATAFIMGMIYICWSIPAKRSSGISPLFL